MLLVFITIKYAQIIDENEIDKKMMCHPENENFFSLLSYSQFMVLLKIIAFYHVKFEIYIIFCFYLLLCFVCVDEKLNIILN